MLMRCAGRGLFASRHARARPQHGEPRARRARAAPPGGGRVAARRGTTGLSRAAIVLAAALGLAAPLKAQTAQTAPTADEPYSVSVWARVLFGPDGLPAQYALVDEGKYPAEFAENVKARVAKARIPAPTVDGKPVTLRSGVELRFQVTPNGDGGTVRLQGISMGPMPTRRYFASYPNDIARTGGWVGEASALCTVGTDGTCRTIEVRALPGMPESVRRFMRASLEKWEFEPQQVDGSAIEGEYLLAVRLRTEDSLPDDFRESRFLRILRTR